MLCRIFNERQGRLVHLTRVYQLTVKRRRAAAEEKREWQRCDWAARALEACELAAMRAADDAALVAVAEHVSAIVEVL